MWLYGLRKWVLAAWFIILLVIVYQLRGVFLRLAGPQLTWPAALVGVMLSFWMGMFIYRLLSEWWVRRELALAGLPARQIASGYIGMIGGLSVGLLLHPALAISQASAGVLPLMVDLLLGLIGYRIGQLKAAEVAQWFERAKEEVQQTSSIGNLQSEAAEDSLGSIWSEQKATLKLLDTSAIIDGRVADICRTGFLDGPMVVPDFVIQELQQIADSPDLLKRNRGRRGLDILQQLQREHPTDFRIQEVRMESGDVDTRLVRLAKTWRSKIVTNDFNLSKVCDLHGVSVLNMHELANAVKPMVLPGEEFRVQILKDGKEHGQGIGYLDDGTMVVVDAGRDSIGQTIDVIVSSVLQTSAGKMIFSRRKPSGVTDSTTISPGVWANQLPV